MEKIMLDCNIGKQKIIFESWSFWTNDG